MEGKEIVERKKNKWLRSGDADMLNAKQSQNGQ
jgi:hypothetical protein